MKKFVIPIVILLAILGMVGFRIVQKKGSEADTKKQSASRKNAPSVVRVGVAGPKTISNTLESVASLESPFTVKLSPNVAGRIDYLEAREGDAVQKGQVLARIDPAEVEGQILQAQSALAEAKQRLAQAKITEGSNTVGIYSVINQQQASVASTEADYNEVKVTYEATVAAAHEATIDAQAKVRAAESNVKTTQAQEKLAEANLEDSKAKYTRENSLYTQGFIAPQDLDDAKAAEKVNEAQVNAAARIVDAARSALNSAEAQFRAAQNQESIAKKKGMSDIQDAKAKLTQSQATLQTAVANKAQIPAYTENLKALYSEVAAAEAALKQAVARRAYLIVTSSIDGTVTQRLADPGAEASPGSPLLVIQSLKWLYVTSAIPVEYSEQIKPGLDVSMTLDALPGRTFHATIADINKSADPSSRQFMVRMKLENPGNMFRPGMFARLSMVPSVTQAEISVPREAVTTDNSNNSTVTVLSDKDAAGVMTAHVVPVTLGVEDTNNVQILSGVKAGDRVVVLTYRPVKDGAKVTEASAADGKKGGKHGKKGGAADGAPVEGTDSGGAGSPGTAGASAGTAGSGGTAGTTGAAAGGTAGAGR